jgi:hypothetical protein
MRITVSLPMRFTDTQTVAASVVVRVEADNWHDLLAIAEHPQLQEHSHVLEVLYGILSGYSTLVDPPINEKVRKERYDLFERTMIELDWTICAPEPVRLPTVSGND